MRFREIARRIEAVERRLSRSSDRKLTAIDLVVVDRGLRVVGCTQLRVPNEVRDEALDDGARGTTAWLWSALDVPGWEGAHALA